MQEPLTYSRTFQVLRVRTADLQSKERVAILLMDGFQWIRRVDTRPFHQILRAPAVGCLVEISTGYQPWAIPLNSAKARQLIQRRCYF